MSTALVVSGGGSKGAFAIGAIGKLREAGISFDMVAGTSTGSLIAPFVVTDEIDDLKRIYTQVRTEDILIKRRIIDLLTHDSIYNAHPLWSLLSGMLTEERYQAIVESDIEMYITTVNLQTGQLEYWNQHKKGPIGSRARLQPLPRTTLLRAILASACEPVLMPNVRILPPFGDQYTDGGVREIAPLKIAIDQGATDLYAIVLSPETRERADEDYVFIVKTLMRTIDLFLQEVVTNDVARALMVNRAVVYLKGAREKARTMLTSSQVAEIFSDPANPDPFDGKRLLNLNIIRPESELPLSGLEFRPWAMAQMMTMGERAAEAALERGPITM